MYKHLVNLFLLRTEQKSYCCISVDCLWFLWLMCVDSSTRTKMFLHTGRERKLCYWWMLRIMLMNGQLNVQSKAWLFWYDFNKTRPVELTSFLMNTQAINTLMNSEQRTLLADHWHTSWQVKHIHIKHCKIKNDKNLYFARIIFRITGRIIRYVTK